MRRFSLMAMVLAIGCTQPAVDRTPKKDKAPPPVVAADTPGRQAADHIAWNTRAAELLPKVVDNKTAEAHAGELMKLVRDKEELNARAGASKSWERTKEEKDALEKEFGEKLRASTTQYMNAAKPFSTIGKSREVVKYLVDQHGIDIGRMVTVKK